MALNSNYAHFLEMPISLFPFSAGTLAACLDTTTDPPLSMIQQITVTAILVYCQFQWV